MEIAEKEMTVWLTYHDDAQIEQYNLKEDDTIRLFKGNNTEVEGENINHLNRFYSEMTTMYWVWKEKQIRRFLPLSSSFHSFHGNRAWRMSSHGDGKFSFHCISAL